MECTFVENKESVFEAFGISEERNDFLENAFEKLMRKSTKPNKDGSIQIDVSLIIKNVFGFCETKEEAAYLTYHVGRYLDRMENSGIYKRREE